MSIDIQILVNGNRCKTYFQNSKTFLEAKEGSEYEIYIKNNSSSRILAVSSVDGRNVLTGETATDDDAGYVIDGYSAYTIKGFRYNNSAVGAFKFTSQHKSYSAGLGTPENCGVIGVKIFSEKIEIPQFIWANFTTPKEKYWGPKNWDPQWLSQPNIICNTNTLNGSTKTLDSSGPMYTCCVGNSNNLGTDDILRSMSCSSQLSPSFDMGTSWGQKKNSRVVETEFKRDSLLVFQEFYYASRQSLIDFGIQLDTYSQVSFPQSFPKKYATPPSGWRG